MRVDQRTEDDAIVVQTEVATWSKVIRARGIKAGCDSERPLAGCSCRSQI